MSEMAISNAVYPILIKTVNMQVSGEVSSNEDTREEPSRASRIWPVLRLAASRKDKVSGRTRLLVISIISKNGFSQPGAPLGINLAKKERSLWDLEDKIVLAQMGRARVRVRSMWEEKGNE